MLDRKLSGPISLVAGAKLLKDHQVTNIFYLDSDAPTPSTASLVYLTRPDVKLMELIADHVHDHFEENIQHDYHIVFVPRRTMLCERVLADRGVFGDVKTLEYSLDLIPLDEDLLTLDIHNSFRNCFLDGDPTPLYYIASSIMKLQTMFGIIPRIHGKGHNASMVLKLLQRMRSELQTDMFNNVVPEISNVILIDRNVDLVSPMLTQLTYEGLIDEVFGIEDGIVEIPESILASENEKGKSDVDPDSKKKHPLNSGDTLFQEIRDMNFRVIGYRLNRKAAEIKETYSEKDSAKSVQQLKHFLTKFKSANKEHTYLTTHIALAEEISKTTKTVSFDKLTEAEQMLIRGTSDCEDYIEAAISKAEPLIRVLRLLCLLSCTHGIKQKKFDFLRREILHTYGFDTVYTLTNLEKMGLFRAATGKSPWGAIRKALHLVDENVDLRDPQDFHHVFSGYAPLLVRLVEHACQPDGWKSIEDVMHMLPGPTFEVKQDIHPSVEERLRIIEAESGDKKPVTLVFFIGGVTFAEISALRYLGQKENHKRDYIIATTSVVNGNSLVEEVQETIVNKLRRPTAGPMGKR